MRRLVGVLFAVIAAVLAACSPSPPPEITFFTDGESTRTEPLNHCDALLESCDPGGDPATLTARQGKPVQISLPSEVSETPWAVNVQYLDDQGESQMEQEVFTDGTQSAYTVTPAPEEQVVVVEIQQLGAAYSADEQGEPILDEQGEPQLVMRGVWSLQVDPVA